MRPTTLLLHISVLACMLTASVFQPAVAEPATFANSSAKSTSKVTSSGKRKVATKPTSPCRGLVKQACEGVAICGWIKPKKQTDTRGRRLTAHCRKTERTGKTAAKSEALSSR